MQALWAVDLTEHGVPETDSAVASLTFNPEQDTILAGLGKGSLFCIQLCGEEGPDVEEVLTQPVLLCCR